MAVALVICEIVLVVELSHSGHHCRPSPIGYLTVLNLQPIIDTQPSRHGIKRERDSIKVVTLVDFSKECQNA